MADTKISAKSILAQFSVMNITQIDGKPTHCNINVEGKELTEKFISVWCPWLHGKGCLGVIHDIVLYLQRNGENLDIPTYP